MAYVNDKGVEVKFEECTYLRYTLSSDRMVGGDFTGEVSRHGPGGIVYGKEEMLCLMLFEINGTFKFKWSPEKDRDVIVKREDPYDASKDPALISAFKRLAIGQNQTLISPPFQRNVGLRPDIWKCPLPGVIRIYHQLDDWRFNRYLGNGKLMRASCCGSLGSKFHEVKTTQQVMRKWGERINWVSNWSERRKPQLEVPSLFQLAYERASYAHRSFYQSEHGPMVAYSMANVHLKIPFMVKTFNQPTHKMNDACKAHMHLLAPALDRMIDLIGVRHRLGTLKWKLMPELLEDARATSGGERADHKQEFKFPGGKVIHTAIGQKTINVNYTAQKAAEFFEKCKTEVPDFLHANYKVANKHEMHYASGDPGSCNKIQQKMREFYIPNAMVIVVERALFLFKHLVHRGHTIRIGTTWWWGGAQKLYDHLYTPGCVAFDGDFKAIDKTIKAILLGLHTNAGTMFLDLKGMDPVSVRQYRNALKVMSKVKVVKVTRLNGNTWVVIKGIMPSGVLETSDGDSWVVCLVLAMWVEWERANSKQALAAIDRYWEEEFRAAIYGDDHGMAIGPHLTQYLNEDRFALYVFNHWDMEIREKRANLALLAHVENDVLLNEALIFLKRYMIERPPFMPDNTSKIVPWKPAYNHFVRIPYSDNGFAGWTRVIVSIIGHVWDSMGTNLTAYQELSVLYQLALAESQISARTLPKLVEEEFKNEKIKTKMLAKMRITEKDMYAFPDMADLHRRHVYQAHITNIVDPNRAFQSSELEGMIQLLDS